MRSEIICKNRRVCFNLRNIDALGVQLINDIMLGYFQEVNTVNNIHTQSDPVLPIMPVKWSLTFAT